MRSNTSRHKSRRRCPRERDEQPSAANAHVETPSLLVLNAPRAEIIGGIGLLALAANLFSVLLLLRYKEGDANVRSVWLCSRNDAIGNVMVVVAALAVWGSSTASPDLIVAGVMAGVFMTSATQILRQALDEARSEPA